MFGLQVFHESLVPIETEACNLGNPLLEFEIQELLCDSAVVFSCWGGNATEQVVIHHNKKWLQPRQSYHVGCLM